MNVHEAARLALRKAMAADAGERFRALNGRAAARFAEDFTPTGRIEWLYHLLCADPERGAAECEALDRKWSGASHPEDRYALALALGELESSGLVAGRARVEVLLCVAEARSARGNTAQLPDTATEALALAKCCGHAAGEVRANSLVGEALLAQGKLAEAQAAFAEVLRISRALAELDPGNARWQRDLAVACWKLARMEKEMGRVSAAVVLYDEVQRIYAALVKAAPGFVQWAEERGWVERELAEARRLAAAPGNSDSAGKGAA